MSGDGADYEVGYGKPPKHTRFEKGQSGNPKGRPKGSRSVVAILESELNQKITVREGEKRKKITKKEALVKRLVKDAADGKHSAMRDLLALIQGIDAKANENAQARVLSQTEQALVAELMKKAGVGELP